MIKSEFFILKSVKKSRSLSGSYVIFDHNQTVGDISFRGNRITQYDLIEGLSKDYIHGKVIFLPIDGMVNIYFVSKNDHIFPLSPDIYDIEIIQEIIESPELAKDSPSLKYLLEVLEL